MQTGRELPEQRHPVIQAVTNVRVFEASKANLQAAMEAHPELHNVLLNKLHRKRSNAILVRAMSSFHLHSRRASTEVSGSEIGFQRLQEEMSGRVSNTH